MTLKPWIFAILAVVLLLIGALAGSEYVTPTPGPKIEAGLKENSCAIHCPAGSAYSAMQASASCQAGTAPQCQCTSAQEPMAKCVPVP